MLKGKELTRYVEVDAWEREEYMDLKLRREESIFPVLERSPSSSVFHRACSGVSSTWFWGVAG